MTSPRRRPRSTSRHRHWSATAKQASGLRYVELARKIYYSKEARAEWLAAGGTRQADDHIKADKSEPEPVAKSFPAKVRMRPSPGDERVRAVAAAPTGNLQREPRKKPVRKAAQREAAR
jgi:hypothetical protein